MTWLFQDKVSKNFNARGEAKDSAARQTKMAFVDQVSKPPREVRVQQVDLLFYWNNIADLN